jgi:SAM-dependent methyltransferase
LAWDCACGNGQATTELMLRFERVVGTDVSLAQLASADRRTWPMMAAAVADRAPVAAASVDAVTVAQALHWFAGDSFFAEAQRVLAPGGVFAAWTYGMPRISDALVDRAVLRFYTETVGSFWPPERRHVEEGYRSIDLPFAELVTPRLELTASWALPDLVGFLRSWSATGRYIAAHGADPVTPFADELQSLWVDLERRTTVTWPLVVRAGRA